MSAPGADAVVAISARRESVQLQRELRFGGLSIMARSYCLVEVELADGRRGTSRSIDRGIDVSAIVRDLVAPAYLRHAQEPTEVQWERALASASPALSSGAGLRALSLVDVAVDSARAGTSAHPLTRPRPPVWAIVGYPPSEEPRVVAMEAQRAIALGAAGVKLPVGVSPELSRARLEATARAVGAERVAIDLAWTAATPDEAARAVDGIQVAWLEDPFPPGRTRDLVRLRSLLSVPLAVGDEDSQLYHPDVLVSAGAVDIVRLDAVSQGGITRIRQLAEDLAGSLVPVSWHMSAALHSSLAATLELESVSVEVSAPHAGVDPLDETISLDRTITELSG